MTDKLMLTSVAEEDTGFARSCEATWKGYPFYFTLTWDTFNGYDVMAFDSNSIPKELETEFWEWWNEFDYGDLDEITLEARGDS
jgi:hypothetical protein